MCFVVAVVLGVHRQEMVIAFLFAVEKNQPGIRFWVLTGDKMETAVCCLISAMLFGVFCFFKGLLAVVFQQQKNNNQP